jgi:hypothetical protein
VSLLSKLILPGHQFRPGVNGTTGASAGLMISNFRPAMLFVDALDGRCADIFMVPDGWTKVRMEAVFLNASSVAGPIQVESFMNGRSDSESQGGADEQTATVAGLSMPASTTQPVATSWSSKDWDVVPGEPTYFEIRRNPAAAADTLAQTIGLLYIRVVPRILAP